MTKNLFDYDDYRIYLSDLISKRDRGFRSLLAEKLRCQRTFISQVLGQTAHFNLEHGASVSQILGHSDDEADFFLLLIQYTRAATPLLRGRLGGQLKKTRELRTVLKNRFKVKDALYSADKVEYYSSWLYGAIRVLVTIPEFQSRGQIERHLKISSEQCSKVVDFLLSRGLVVEKNSRLTASEKHLYLGNDTKLISKHHTNWRIRAIQSLDSEKATDLHYSSVNSLSGSDLPKVRELLAKTLEEFRATVKDSHEECLYSLCIDFFQP